MKRLMILGIALLLLSSTLIAQPVGMKAKMPNHPKMMKQHPGMNRGMGGGMDMKCIEAMELTPAQQKKIDELKTGFNKTKNTLEAEIENLKIDMHAAMKAENFNQAKTINKNVFAKQNVLADARIDMMAAIVKELTPAQKEIMKKSMMQNMGQKHQMQGMQGGKGMKDGMGRGKHMGDCSDCETDKDK
ncbi:MAG: Spy/CpxP family protein refolding chaperone [Candidatus Cloacimonetes bacterium]|nr:Spy/CpxP family protein refolding chaperone [Candidatus Cloacimonadota bacterium]